VSESLWAPYDAMGEHFERHAIDGAYNAHYDRPAVLEALGSVRARRVLDAGCGPGLYAEVLLDAGAQVVGFDASQMMVDLARRRVGERAQIDLARLGESLPYPEESFDLVVCALAIHYADDRAAAFADLYRVLTPGGALVVSTSHPMADALRSGGSYFDRVLETDMGDSPDGRHAVRYWREPLSDLCAAALRPGFVIDLLTEPKPAESMRDRHPEAYETLSREPAFLVLRLHKPA